MAAELPGWAGGKFIKVFKVLKGRKATKVLKGRKALKATKVLKKPIHGGMRPLEDLPIYAIGGAPLMARALPGG
jgi:hypothetical protein